MEIVNTWLLDSAVNLSHCQTKFEAGTCCHISILGQLSNSFFVLGQIILLLVYSNCVDWRTFLFNILDFSQFDDQNKNYSIDVYHTYGPPHLPGSHFHQIRMWNQEFYACFFQSKSLHNQRNSCEVSGSHNGCAEDLSVFQYDTVSSGKYLPPFQKIVLTPTLGWSNPRRNGLFM